MVNPDFPYRDEYNRFFIRMRTAGLFQRMSDRLSISSKFGKSADIYDSVSTYDVATKGVMFMQTKYFIVFFACSIIVAFIVLIFENVIYRVRNYFAA